MTRLHMFSSARTPIWDMLSYDTEKEQENWGNVQWPLKLLIGCGIHHSAHISLTKTSHILRLKKKVEMSIGRYCESHANG